MNLIIDTNVIISALIRDSSTREIILHSEHKFYYPKDSMEELEKHKEMIISKSGLEELEYNQLFDTLFNKINVIALEKFMLEIPYADEIIGIYDKNDVLFIALALSIENDGIWTDDKDFQRQNVIKIFQTSELFN